VHPAALSLLYECECSLISDIWGAVETRGLTGKDLRLGGVTGCCWSTSTTMSSLKDTRGMCGECDDGIMTLDCSPRSASRDSALMLRALVEQLEPRGVDPTDVDCVTCRNVVDDCALLGWRFRPSLPGGPVW
jgi:hypothetical protein